MLMLSAMLSLLRNYLKAHEVGGASVPPEDAGTVARLLASCAVEAKALEARASPSDTATGERSEPDTNVVSFVAFARSRTQTPPTDPTKNS